MTAAVCYPGWADVAPSLMSEAFSSPEVGSAVATCNPDGTSTITFDVSGTAVGPYPGAFHESGTVTIGPQNGPPDAVAGYPLPTGPVVSLSASFTINSVAGQVSGTKVLSMT